MVTIGQRKLKCTLGLHGLCRSLTCELVDSPMPRVIRLPNTTFPPMYRSAPKTQSYCHIDSFGREYDLLSFDPPPHLWNLVSYRHILRRSDYNTQTTPKLFDLFWIRTHLGPDRAGLPPRTIFTVQCTTGAGLPAFSSGKKRRRDA